MIWAQVNLTVLWANTQSWHKNSVTDPLECSLKQTVCPKHEENARKIEKNRGFFWKIFKKNIPYWRFELFHIGGHLFNKNFGLQQKYSVLEVYSVLEYSVLEFLLYSSQSLADFLPICLTQAVELWEWKNNGYDRYLRSRTELWVLYSAHLILF